ncbi:MAG: hypothetical protein AAGG45_03330 [Pseudomonadota bacterium]
MLDRLFKRGQKTKDDPEESVETGHVARCEERYEVYIEAMLLSRSGVEKHGIITDLSNYGARMRFVSTDGLVIGDMVKVRAILKSFRAIGEIRWKDKTDLGIRLYKRN